MSQRVLPRLTRAAVAATTVALAATTFAAPASAGERERDRSAATGWVVGELEDGRFHSDRFGGFDDWGLTIDGLFALAADPDRTRAAKRVGRAVRNHVDDYTVYQGDRAAGATGKVLLAARVLRADPRSFGGHDVRGDLLGLLDRRGPDRGRLKDSGTSDFSNTLGQAYGVLGLSRSGGVPGSAVHFLLEQRCSEGYFRLTMTAATTCNDDSSSADVDATALAVQALVAADRRGGVSVRDRLIERSGAWLARVQRRSGGFGGGVATPATNTNSTGVAAQALSLTGHDAAVREAGQYVANMQVVRADGRRLAGDRGAIAYNREGLRLARQQGITAETRDQFRRATTQAVFALKPAPLGGLRVRR
jgi:hypothetical protein